MGYEARMRDAEDDNMSDGDRGVPSDYAFGIAQEADAALAAKDAEIAKLREELEGARKVIEELVALKDMKQAKGTFNGWPSHAVRDDYEHRQPAAWEQARAFLARKEAK